MLAPVRRGFFMEDLMPLNWNVRNVKDFQNRDPEERDAMIWSLLAIGIPEITAENVDQVFARISAVEKTLGPIYPPLYITKEMVESWVGLKTNLQENTKRMFRERLMDAIETRYRGNEW